MKEYDSILREAGINPTSIRILILKCLINSQTPMSLSDLETNLDSVDKSTISRTLTIFKEHHIVHSFNDGSGSMKYEICKSQDHENFNDMHVHFRCEKCGNTLCMTSVSIPTVELPKGFQIHEISYVISGICPSCSN